MAKQAVVRTYSTDIEKEAREHADKIEKRQKCCRYDIDESYITGYEDGYIAGAKAHSVKWHDLRKNPDDLPKTDADVVCYCGEEWRKVIGKYWTEYKKWEVDGVIEWCELPKFEE